MSNNTEKNNISKNVRVVANLVEGYNPLDFVRIILNSDGTQGYYLDVKDRKAWFRAVYPKGRIVTEIRTIDEKKAIVECKIYEDTGTPQDEFLANGYAQKFCDVLNPFSQQYLECAETAAIGRALASAGFNIQGGASDDDDGNSLVDAPVDTGSNPPSQGQTESPSPESPAQAPIKPEASPSAPQQPPTHLPGEKGEIPVEVIVQTMTLEQAMGVIVPFKNHRGKTLGQVATEKPDTVDYILKSDGYKGPDNRLRAAARVLKTEALKGQQAG